MWQRAISGSSGGGKYNHDTEISLTANTPKKITVGFEPKTIVCRTYDNPSTHAWWLYDTYSSEIDSANQYYYRKYGSAGGVESVPTTSLGLGFTIQSIESDGFTVQSAGGDFAYLDWEAWG